ncbi:hypothetical protein J2857_002556 [Neorhizobium galegae]|nr:hypothetical protein [Neorhizobium galegae]
MKTVNIHEAKTHLSRLVEEAANGEAFVIAKAGQADGEGRAFGRSACGRAEEGMLLLTSDEAVAQYDGPIRLVR